MYFSQLPTIAMLSCLALLCFNLSYIYLYLCDISIFLSIVDTYVCLCIFGGEKFIPLHCGSFEFFANNTKLTTVYNTWHLRTSVHELGKSLD